ncbi:PhzF family phenazine biosynthesis protein [Kitasatospora arboriphila]
MVSRSELAALAPDADRLRAACDRLGLLGCYAYSPPTAGRLAARMFAPSIGVPEDIANVNSTACVAARLAGAGVPSVAVDMGDVLGAPATVTAALRGAGPGPPCGSAPRRWSSAPSVCADGWSGAASGGTIDASCLYNFAAGSSPGRRPDDPPTPGRPRLAA